MAEIENKTQLIGWGISHVNSQPCSLKCQIVRTWAHAEGSDPGFSNYCFCHGSCSIYEILCVPFENGVSNSHSPLALPKVTPISRLSKPNILRAHLPGTGYLTEELNGWLRLLCPWEEPLQFYLSSHLWVAHLGVWTLNILHLYSC